GAADAARRLPPAAGGRVDLGSPGRLDHRVQSGREGSVLRTGRRQGVPASDVLRPARRCGAPVTVPTSPASTVELGPPVQYVLRLGDDALVLAQRLGEWSAKAPELEEDVALTNIALALLGQARALLSHAGRLEERGRDEDALAFLRDERDWVNVQLVEQPGGDFADTIARQLFFSAYQYELYGRLVDSVDETLAAVAAKAVKEVTYHRDHAAQWVVRLGDGTEVSHARMQAGLERM